MRQVIPKAVAALMFGGLLYACWLAYPASWPVPIVPFAIACVVALLVVRL